MQDSVVVCVLSFEGLESSVLKALSHLFVKRVVLGLGSLIPDGLVVLL